MQRNRFISMPSRKDAAPVTVLCPVEALRIHPEPILRMYGALGEQAAGVLVQQMRDDLTHRLGRVRLLHAGHDLPAMTREAHAVAAKARTLGLVDLADVAETVAGCAGRSDPAALAATVGRMVRLGHAATLHFTTTVR